MTSDIKDSQSISSPSALTLLKDAALYAVQGAQWQLALDCWTIVLKHSPTSFSAKKGQADALIQLGELHLAEDIFESLSRSHPTQVHGWQGLALVAMRTQQWSLLLERCAVLQQKFPNQLQGYLWQSTALVNLGRLNQAENTFVYLSEQYPKQVHGWRGLALVAMRTQQWPLALERCAVLQQRFPNQLQGYAWQGNALLALNQLDSAENTFSLLTKQHPARMQGFAGLARVAISRRQWTIAHQRWDSVLQKFPQEVSGYIGKMTVFLKLEDFNRAELLSQHIPAEHYTNVLVLKTLVTLSSFTRRWTFTLDKVNQFILHYASLLPTLRPNHELFELIDRVVTLLLNSGECSGNEFLLTERLLDQLESQKCSDTMMVVWRSRLVRSQRDFPAEEICPRTLANTLCLDALPISTAQSGAYDHIYLELAKNAWHDFDLDSVLHFGAKVTCEHPSIHATTIDLVVKALIRQNNTSAAKEQLRQLLTQQPYYVPSYVALSEILCFHDKNYAETLHTCEQAIAHGIADQKIYGYKALALCELGHSSQAVQLLAQYLQVYEDSAFVQMAYAEALRRHQDYEKSIAVVNRWLAAGDFSPIVSTGSCCKLTIDCLQCHPGYVIDSEDCVSVIMTTYRRDALVPYAIASILNQTYRNLELIIVDDCSPDDNLEHLQAIAQSDPRIRLLQLPKNVGTYVAKNHGMTIATGPYISFMDADDWLHPQTLERQIESLQNPHTLGVMCGRFRIDEKSHIEFKPESPTNQAHITLCFKRDPVLITLGYFDAVRTDADTEYLARFLMTFGQQALKQMRYPCSISTRHADSITGSDSDLGFAWYGLGSNNMMYASAFRQWHRQLRFCGLSPFMPHPVKTRLFAVPKALLP